MEKNFWYEGIKFEWNILKRGLEREQMGKTSLDAPLTKDSEYLDHWNKLNVSLIKNAFHSETFKEIEAHVLSALEACGVSAI